MTSYIGRFAPSPTGPLHAGSLVAALASWLDARAHGGQWLVRIEDVDQPRCVAGMGEHILTQLAACGLVPDAPPVWQAQRRPLYQAALDRLIAQGLAYPCACSRQDVLAALAGAGAGRERHGELVYPGTCRAGLQGRVGRAWRLRTDAAFTTQEDRPASLVDIEHTATNSVVSPVWHWIDRRLGPQQQDLSQAVGDFVLLRADHCFAYQLAVVVDDAAQDVTHVVRGEDLADNTARQIALQQALGLPTPQYLHTPLVLGANGEKLSKQNGAQALDVSEPLAALNQAALQLGLTSQAGQVAQALRHWTAQWRAGFL